MWKMFNHKELQGGTFRLAALKAEYHQLDEDVAPVDELLTHKKTARPLVWG
jgi:hypothetical protein